MKRRRSAAVLRVMFSLPPDGSGFFEWMGFAVWRRADGLEAWAYAGFNALEAAAWFAIAGWVLARWVRRGRSRVELVYAALFVLFGLTDVAEAHAVTGWLLLAKGLVLANLLTARLYVTRVCHPGDRM